MKFIVKEERREIKQPTVQKVLDLIATRLQSDCYYNGLIVDGHPIDGDYATYISTHLDDIHELELVTQTLEQMLYNNLVMARDYLERAMENLPLLADHFYAGPKVPDWQGFSNFVQGMEWIGKLVETIRENKRIYGKHADQFLDLYGNLRNQLKVLEDAVAVKDTVTIPDTILYELQPQLLELKNAIGSILVRKGKINDTE
ncbi:hypothetical protein E4665_12320 [Sporolactobacillus shoreae]|uniref:Uncharacterized protein n=1 Tax=Sporolactobacillus shoreae TaxID=1465501 RepID=A0A4Z0GNB5_9BACL|nr:hypothetical protein [Sporolactobacillus shoreae]TGA97404.1 hypothetical protein E4665_12320 [Sporolactobacillus shoreae]